MGALQLAGISGLPEGELGAQMAVARVENKDKADIKKVVNDFMSHDPFCLLFKISYS